MYLIDIKGYKMINSLFIKIVYADEFHKLINMTMNDPIIKDISYANQLFVFSNEEERDIFKKITESVKAEYSLER